MKRLRHFFLTRQLREKVLLLAFVGLAVVVWVSSWSERLQARLSETSSTSVDLTVQKQWLDRRAVIEASAKSAVDNLDSSRTFNAVRLNNELNSMATLAGLARNYSIVSGNPEKMQDFTVNSLEFRTNQVAYDALWKFYEELMKRAPYIGIEQFSVTAVQGPPGNPSNLNVRMTITSVEIAR